jgi:8-oxo-dGTP diphosphatase
LEKNLTLIPVVAAALIDQNGRILLQRRCHDGSHGGRWEFPGGKVIDGESPEMALVREISEELGIGIDPANLLPLAFASDPAQPPMPREPYVILLYTCRTWHGDPQSLAGEAIGWFEAAALADMARQAETMPPLDIPLVHALLQLIYPLANNKTHI